MRPAAARAAATSRSVVALTVALGGLACEGRPPFTELTVRDPTDAARGFATLHLGLAQDRLEPVALTTPRFPTTVTVVAKATGNAVLWGEARDGDGSPLARGSAPVRFARRGSPAATLTLAKSCDIDSDCVTGRFCAGEMRCIDGGCITVVAPCASDVACVVATCTDLPGGAGECAYGVDHSRCPDGTYCDTGAGCLPGRRCMPATASADCDDGRACNGVERCDRYRCEPGTPIDVDDGDPCTLDGCNDGLVPPVFHEALVANEGNACTTATGVVGVCLTAAGGCVACDLPERCGPACAACPPETPRCLGPLDGCACELSPAPRGSCPRGNRCDGSACVPCDDAARCGPECAPCDGVKSACGGPQAGCVVPSCSGQPDFTPCSVVTDPDRWYDICVAGLCVSPGCGDASCNPPGPSFARADREPGWQYPDTGQHGCYDGTGQTQCSTFPCQPTGAPAFCGQDAQYGWDVAHPDPAVRWTLVDDPEPVVLDAVTGLEWQACAAELTGPGCAEEERFVLGFTWDEALVYCDGLRWSGHHDWRLPDITELWSLVDHSRPTRYPEALPRAEEIGNVWSLTTSPSEVDDAWSGGGGTSYISSKSAFAAALCVRAGPSIGPWGSVARFARTQPIAGSGEYTVADRRTGLVWQGCPIGQTGVFCDTGAAIRQTWRDALATCEGLTWGGASDWRLPSIVELLSLAAMRVGDGSPDQSIFPGTWHPYGRWSSTSVAASPGRAYGLALAGVGLGDDSKDYTELLFCVRTAP